MSRKRSFTPQDMPVIKDDGLISVELIKPHRHGGREYPVGEVIPVSPAIARRLLSWKVIAKLPDGTPTTD